MKFDVSKREGQVESALLALRIERGGDVIKRIEQVELESPRVLYAQVLLDDPLRTGNYDVAIMEGDEELARKAEAFFVPAGTSTEAPDAGPLDAGLGKDAGVGDDGGEDGGVDPDTGVSDGPPPDAGFADSGLGPFEGTYRYRRLIAPNNGVAAPAGVTIEIPVDHQTMLTSSTAFAMDGADLAIYQGPDRLQHQWRDRFAVGTDDLVIVARLVRDLPAGGSESDPLVLYSGDAAATLDVTDEVFEFSERFLAPVDGAWFEANTWGHCNLDRPIERILDQETEPSGAYCAIDASTANLSRSSLATPNLANVVAAPGANLTYEMSIWMAGRTIDGPADILYASYGPNNDQFDDTTEHDPAAYAGFVPNGTLTFMDVDGEPRTVAGWRHPPDVIEWWQRTTVRFTPIIDNPSLHFRYVSTDPAASNSSFSAIDDWWVRLALDPDFAPVLGPVEAR